jgi:L-cysteine desulfidase
MTDLKVSTIHKIVDKVQQCNMDKIKIVLSKRVNLNARTDIVLKGNYPKNKIGFHLAFNLN